MMTMTKQTETQKQAHIGARYFVRIRKQYGHTRFCANFYIRHILRNLKRTPVGETPILLINAPRHLMLFTSYIHPEDAETIRRNFDMFPEVEMFPVVRDVWEGDPLRRYIFCVNIFPPRKSARLPQITQHLKHYRWIVYEKVGGEKQGILISEEPPVVPYRCELTTEAYLITASEEQDCIRYHDLRGYNADFAEPLSPPHL